MTVYTWQVIDVELGSMVPGISNLRALPCPTEALWPQTVFDLDYGGALLSASRCQYTGLLATTSQPLKTCQSSNILAHFGKKNAFCFVLCMLHTVTG